MKALVIGFGVSGKSAKAFLEKRGYEVEVYDDALAPKEIEDLSVYSLVVLSPGISKEHPLCKMAKNVTSEMELGLGEVDQPCIGITGTNGKSTVVQLVTHVLSKCGKKALAVGNVGVPITSILPGDEILVIELSSYQLEDLSIRALDVAACLNITEDHLDRYPSMKEYQNAKAQIQHCVKEGGVLFAHESIDSTLFPTAQIYDGDHVSIAQLICKEFGVGEKEFFQASSSFSKPPHRLEWVANKKGTDYYNDSKGTNIAAVSFAIKTMQKKVVLLLGGQDKNLRFAPLKAYKNKLAHIIAFGEARVKIANELQDVCAIVQVETLQEAVSKAGEIATSEDTVLFSPGCTSFDAFRNAEERGEEFRNLVLLGERHDT